MEQLWYYLFHVCPIFCKFHKYCRFVEVLSTSSFTALHCSVNFWILLKFSNFFLICSFHKNHRFSWGLPYLPFYCFSLMQWIFNFFVIFATVCKPGCISSDTDHNQRLLEGHLLDRRNLFESHGTSIRSFQCNPTAINNIWDTPARKLADTCVFLLFKCQ